MFLFKLREKEMYFWRWQKLSLSKWPLERLVHWGWGLVQQKYLFGCNICMQLRTIWPFNWIFKKIWTVPPNNRQSIIIYDWLRPAQLRAVASNIRRPRVESSHRQLLLSVVKLNRPAHLSKTNIPHIPHNYESHATTTTKLSQLCC